MPSPRVISTAVDNPDPHGVEQFFSKLGKDIRDKQDQNEIGNLIGQYQQNRQDANAWEDLQLGLEKSSISPTKRLQTQKSLNDVQKNVIERDKVLNAEVKAMQDQHIKNLENQKTEQKEKNKLEREENEKIEKRNKEVLETETILTQSGVDPEEAKRLSSLISPATARTMVKPVKSPKGAKEKFEEGLAGEASKEVPKMEQAIAKGKDALTNIDRIETLATENLKGLKGYVKAAFNTEAAAEVNTLGATNLETVIKLFNPVGALPTQKLNWIRSTFSVSPWDNLSTIKGKLNTQKIITQQSIDRAEERNKLLKKYYGNIPEDVSKEFDKKTEDILNGLEKKYSPSQGKKAPEGKVRVKDKKTGQTGSVTPYPGMEEKYDVLE